MVLDIDSNKPTTRAVIACAQWLGTCLDLGWPKSDLDFLEGLWWKYHDRRGNLCDEASAVGAVRKRVE